MKETAETFLGYYIQSIELPSREVFSVERAEMLTKGFFCWTLPHYRWEQLQSGKSWPLSSSEVQYHYSNRKIDGICHTTEDNQSVITIDVYEGERSMVTSNHLLGLFDYKGLPPMPCGEVEVRVTFTIDANGILEVTAENKGMKNVQKITINPETGRLSQDDIDRMVKEGDQYFQEDAELRERIEARNKLEWFVYSISITLSRTGPHNPPLKFVCLIP
eukprot:scaffold32538_cov46-Attheya_sp.AAC.2